MSATYGAWRNRANELVMIQESEESAELEALLREHPVQGRGPDGSATRPGAAR